VTSELVNELNRILVVDDDEMLNQLFCAFLQSNGFDTVSADGVQRAKQLLLQDSAIDLMLLDYQLADGVGMDLLADEGLKDSIRHIPIIMISSNEEPNFLARCFEGGVDDYIIKPVNLSLLALKVLALIKSVRLKKLITAQNAELEKFKSNVEREEQVAKFTYEYLLAQNSYSYKGVNTWLKPFTAFSGDMALAKKSPVGSLYFLLADATGHGLSAAITIMPLVTIFNSMVEKGYHLQQIVLELNRKLVSNTPMDRFVAAILMEINPLKMELNVWNGAMPTAYWVDDGQVVHQFKSTHMALGILNERQFDADVTTIRSPDKGYVVACSDGLLEQENGHHEAFGVETLLSIIEQRPGNLINHLANALADHAKTENYSDDVSICIIEPNLVFEANDYKQDIEVPLAKSSVPEFSCEFVLTGMSLANCDIPPMCTHFLQQLGLNQRLCQKIFSVIAEMINNAIDHGVLKLSSAIKQNPEGFSEYFVEREKRLSQLTPSDFVRTSMHWNNAETPECLMIEVEDSGSGYNYFVSNINDMEQSHGRGNNLIRRLSETVEIFPPGNKIRAIVK